MQSKPIVKWVGKKVADKVNFFRVDMGTQAGIELMDRFNIPLNSAYLIFDQNGIAVWRSYAIPLNGRKALSIINDLLANQQSELSTEKVSVAK